MNDTGLLRFSIITPHLPQGIIKKYIAETAVVDARLQIMMVIQSFAIEQNRLAIERLSINNLTEPLFDEESFTELVRWIKASLTNLLMYIQGQNYHEAAYLTALNDTYLAIEKALQQKKEELIARKMIFDIPWVGAISNIVCEVTVTQSTEA